MPLVKALSYRYSDYLKAVSAPPSNLEAGYPTYGSYSQSAGLGLSRLSVSLLVSAPSVNPFITLVSRQVQTSKTTRSARTASDRFLRVGQSRDRSHHAGAVPTFPSMSHSTRSTGARGHDIVERVDDPCGRKQPTNPTRTGCPNPDGQCACRRMHRAIDNAQDDPRRRVPR